MKRFIILAGASLVLALGCTDGSGNPTSILAPAAPAPPIPVVSFSESGSETAAATVSTDKDDYAPGETVVVTGTGWLAGESVVMELAEEPQLHELVVISSVADAGGTFVNTDFSPEEHDIGVTFTLTATGQTSGRVATTTFTDGNPGTPVVFVGQSPNPVIAGGSATYTIRIPFTGTTTNCTVSLSATPGASPAWPAPPIGGFFSFSPSSVTGAMGNSPKASVLTVTTPAGMTAASYGFTVTATNDQQTGEDCQGPGTRTSSTITLAVVAAPANTAPNTPSSLAQFKSNGTTAIAVGGATNETTVVLKGVVTDPDAGNTVKLQVEVQPVGTAFTNTATAESGLLSSGSTASATVSSLAEGPYHWQARAVDQGGAMSAWVSFGGNGEGVADFIVDTTPPVVSNVAADPNPARYDEAVMITATATDALTNIASAEYRLDNGSWTGMIALDGGFDELVEDVKATLAAFGQAGVHDICVRATDAAGNTSAGTDCILLAVYDPSAGFVTGGGWILSPEGAYRADLTMTGKATFGFVAKYKKGASTPEGNTEFQFQTAGMNFHSHEYDWLVVAGARAQYKGYGTINGVAGYRFLLTAIDGQENGGGGTDKLRMKIWDDATGDIVYDNQFGQADSGDASTALGGGSIIVHTGKQK